MASELKPCPFCGSKQLTVFDDGDNDPTAFILCGECDSTGPVKLWNRRVPLSPERRREVAERIDRAITRWKRDPDSTRLTVIYDALTDAMRGE